MLFFENLSHSVFPFEILKKQSYEDCTFVMRFTFHPYGVLIYQYINLQWLESTHQNSAYKNDFLHGLRV